MQTATANPYQFSVVDSGVDWLTATARGKDARRSFLAQGEALLKEDAGAGVEITSARIRDYSGWKGNGVFVGTRRDDDLIVLTSSRAAAQWQTVARAATNVSRLDLQVTVWTHGEQPALSRWYYQKCRRLPPQRGRPRTLSLIQTQPAGDTLYVNKRTSDSFGRVYDYATAHKKGEARTLWRYEVEYKRHLASSHAHSLLGERVHTATIEHTVAAWYESRGVQRTWLLEDSLRPSKVLGDDREHDVLLWFESSLSKTVARAIKRYGVAAVLDSLHLSQYVIEDPKRRSNAYANQSTTVVHDADSGRDRESVDHHKVLVQGEQRVSRFDHRD